MDGVQDLWEGEYTYRCILTNDYESSAREIVGFHNLRGGKERIFDDRWIRTSRRYVLNIYTCNNAYADVFKTDFG